MYVLFTSLNAGEDIATLVVHKLDERDKKKSAKVQISTATESNVKHFFKLVGFSVSEGPKIPDTDPQVDKFPWNGRSENEALMDVRDYIEEQLRKYQAPGGFKVVDVHNIKSLLNVDDEKIGNISGGTDILIVPSMTGRAGYDKSINVVFEIKTAANLEAGYVKFESQCFLELLCARVLSDQPGVLVILTDLSSGAMLFEIQYAAEYKRFTVQQTELSLNQMWTTVTKFLDDKAVPDVNFLPMEENGIERDLPVIEFKKTKLSHNVGLALEHFDEMREDTEPNSRERALLMADLFRAMEVPRMPTMVHYSMYA